MAEFSLGTATLGTEVSLDGLKSGMGEAEQTAESGFSKIGGLMAGALATGLAVAGGAIVAGIAAIVKGVASNSEFETFGVQFKVLLGSADAAEQRLKDLAAFGAATPFELPEVVKADKILQGFGLHAEDAAKRFGQSGMEILTIAGDVASGTGAGFTEISTAIGKFASGSTGEAIARFQELGIVTKNELAKLFKEMDSAKAAQTKMDALNVEIGRTKTLIQTLSTDYDRVSGALDKNNRALTEAKGAYGTVKDRVSGLQKALDEAKKALDDLSHPKLAGMDAFDNKLFDLDQQANKAKLAMIGMDKDSPQFETAQKGLDAINEQIDKISLERDIKFEPQLRALEAAAKATGEGAGGMAMNFDQAMAAIANKKGEIAGLTGQFNSATTEMETYKQQVAGLETEHDALTQQLKDIKDASANAKDTLKLQGDQYDALEASMIHFDKGGQLVIKSQEDLDAATGILLEKMKEKYGGMMEQQSATFDGMKSNLSDFMESTLRLVSQPVFDVLKQKLADLLVFLNDPATQEAIKAFAAVLADDVGKAMDWMSTTAIPALIAAWDTIKPVIDTVVGLFTGNVPTALATTGGAFEQIKGIVTTLGTIIRDFWQQNGASIMVFVQETWPKVQQIITDALALINKVFGDNKTEILASMHDTWTVISSIISGALAIIGGVIKVALALINGDWSGAWTAFGEMVRGVWDAILGVIEGSMGRALDNVAKSLVAIGTIVGLLWDVIKAKTVSAWQDIVDYVITPVGKIWETIVRKFTESKDWVVKTFTDILDYITGLPGRWAKAGQELIDALWGPIKDGLNDMYGDFKNGLQRLQDLLNGSEPKDPTSPLRGLGERGAALVANLQAGMDKERLSIDAVAPAMPSVDALGNSSVDRSRTNATTINFTINTQAPHEPILQDIATAQAMAAAGLL